MSYLSDTCNPPLSSTPRRSVVPASRPERLPALGSFDFDPIRFDTFANSQAALIWYSRAARRQGSPNGRSSAKRIYDRFCNVNQLHHLELEGAMRSRSVLGPRLFQNRGNEATILRRSNKRNTWKRWFRFVLSWSLGSGSPQAVDRNYKNRSKVDNI